MIAKNPEPYFKCDDDEDDDKLQEDYDRIKSLGKNASRLQADYLNEQARPFVCASPLTLPRHPHLQFDKLEQLRKERVNKELEMDDEAQKHYDEEMRELLERRAIHGLPDLKSTPKYPLSLPTTGY